MELCKMCRLRDAAPVKSHLIPWFLIRDAVNRQGYKERGYDITFTMSTLSIPKVHFGQRITRDHINEVLGMSVSDDKEVKTQDPFTRTYIFCRECETKLGVLESQYSSRVYKKLEYLDQDELEIDKKGNKIYLLSEYDSKIAKLLVYAIFFRTSIANLNNYSLECNIYEGIRILLDRYITEDPKTFERNINELNISELPYPVFYGFWGVHSTNKSDDNIIVQGRSKIPYFLWANKSIFQIYNKYSHIKSSVQHFFGLSSNIDVSEYISKTLSERSKVCILKEEYRIKAVENAIKFLAQENMKNAKMMLNQCCKIFFNRPATIDESNKFGYYYSIEATQKYQEDSHDPFIKAFTKTFEIKD